MNLNNYSLLTAEQLADQLNVSLRTIRSWQAKSVIPFVKVGRVVRFNLNKVLEALDAFEIQPMTVRTLNRKTS